MVAHPGQLRLIFRSKDKNDRKDAERLAKLLYLGEVPTVHVPSLDVRTWRELINCRSQVIAKRTRAKNAVRALLRSAGIRRRGNPACGRSRELTLAPPTDPAHVLAAVAAGSAAGRDRDAQPATATHRTGIEPPGPADARGAVAAEHPGVGVRTAEAVAAFIDDPHRFPNAKAVGRYFGLVPRQDQSGDKNRLGHITREGAPVVRQLVAEAAWQARRRSPTVRAYFERAQRDDPQRKKIALVATAHYLVRVMWAMLKRGTFWEENPAAAG